MSKSVLLLTLVVLISACKADYITSSSGEHVSNRAASLSVGAQGPILLQDTVLIEELSHLVRERIPDRTVHAKGAGAFGYFEVTNDISQYCGAALFSKVGKRTPIAARFSLGGGGKGSADTKRDIRGFAVKFYTEEGNWDLVTTNLPVIFARDPIFFSSFTHINRGDPASGLTNFTLQWDLFTSRRESVHFLLHQYSYLGIPDGYRYMGGYGVNTFKLINNNGKFVYTKFKLITNQGEKFLDQQTSTTLQGTSPDYASSDLYSNIASGNAPSWTLAIQVMTEKQAQNSRFDPFDATKVWPVKDYPLIEVGTLVLDKNPTDQFTQVDQIAFSPGNFVPGIAASSGDKMLQGRIFAYPDAHKHRLGANFQQLPVNCPFASNTFQRDGPMAFFNFAGNFNYFPNSFDNLTESARAITLSPSYHVTGDVNRYDTGDVDNYSQATDFYNNFLNSTQRAGLSFLLTASLSIVPQDLQYRAVEMFSSVSKELGTIISTGLKLPPK